MPARGILRAIECRQTSERRESVCCRPALLSHTHTHAHIAFSHSIHFKATNFVLNYHSPFIPNNRSKFILVPIFSTPWPFARFIQSAPQVPASLLLHDRSNILVIRPVDRSSLRNHPIARLVYPSTNSFSLSASFPLWFLHLPPPLTFTEFQYSCWPCSTHIRQGQTWSSWTINSVQRSVFISSPSCHASRVPVLLIIVRLSIFLRSSKQLLPPPSLPKILYPFSRPIRCKHTPARVFFFLPAFIGGIFLCAHIPSTHTHNSCRC